VELKGKEMKSEIKSKKSRKDRILKEFIEYWINVAYLAIFFGIFISYKRLVLAEYNIVYTEYGFGLINALILGKVVSIGSMMRIGKRFENRPLIWTTLSRAVLFTVWLAIFNAMELMIRGFFTTYTFQGSLDGLSHIGTYEYFGGLLIVFTSFIPFFAFKELSRVLGSKMIFDLFTKGRQSPAEETIKN
jgi:hypothetical protein